MSPFESDDETSGLATISALFTTIDPGEGLADDASIAQFNERAAHLRDLLARIEVAQ